MRRLLDAGVDVFSAKGYHAARVDDIVRVARTSHGTFYLYFSNKEDLFQALVRDVADELTELTETMEPVTADGQGRAALASWIGQFTDLYERYGSVIRTWTEAEADDTEIGQIGADVLARLAGAFADHISQSAADDIDPQIAALAFVAMVERCNYFVQTGQVRAERDAVVATLADATHAGLFGPTM